MRSSFWGLCRGFSECVLPGMVIGAIAGALAPAVVSLPCTVPVWGTIHDRLELLLVGWALGVALGMTLEAVANAVRQVRWILRLVKYRAIPAPPPPDLKLRLSASGRPSALSLGIRVGMGFGFLVGALAPAVVSLPCIVRGFGTIHDRRELVVAGGAIGAVSAGMLVVLAEALEWVLGRITRVTQ